jgi:hypothetical protein
MKYVTVQDQCGYGVDAGGFRFADAVAVFTEVDDFQGIFFLGDSVDEQLLGAPANRATGMIENCF